MTFSQWIVLIAIIQKSIAPDAMWQSIGHIKAVECGGTNEPQEQAEVFH
ncbi:MAG: hypothetical protein GY927_03330 [bacterium]|nr:hypothetical protein [bacterium]